MSQPFGKNDSHATSAPGTQRLHTFLGGLSYVVATAQYFVIQFYAAAAWNPPYDWFKNYISDLGNTACSDFATPHGSPAFVCSPLHALMNGAFVASGVLLIAGTAELRRFWPAQAATRCGAVLLMISGLGKILVGWVPEDENIVLHSLAAFDIPLASIGICFISWSIFRQHKALALGGLAAFMSGMVATTLSVAAQFMGPAVLFGLGVGGMERLAGYPANIWLAAAGSVAIAEAWKPSRG